VTTRLESLPDGGRVLVANVAHESAARRYAERRGLDYVLTPHIDKGRMFVIDLTALDERLRVGS
jgi:hypothetical protein